MLDLLGYSFNLWEPTLTLCLPLSVRRIRPSEGDVHFDGVPSGYHLSLPSNLSLNSIYFLIMSYSLNFNIVLEACGNHSKVMVFIFEFLT